MATEFSPACMQHMGILEWYRDLAEIFGNDRNVVADLPIDEDCLYLNIWTPMLDGRAKDDLEKWVPDLYGFYKNDSAWYLEG